MMPTKLSNSDGKRQEMSPSLLLEALEKVIEEDEHSGTVNDYVYEDDDDTQEKEEEKHTDLCDTKIQVEKKHLVISPDVGHQNKRLRSEDDGIDDKKEDENLGQQNQQTKNLSILHYRQSTRS